MPQSSAGPARIGYVLKVYPRFSETFIVTEILAREAAGEDLEIFSLRPPADPRFHPELARVQAPVTYLAKPVKLAEGWDIVVRAQRRLPGFGSRFAGLLEEFPDCDPTEIYQGAELAVLGAERGITHFHAHFGSMAARTAQIASRLSGIPFSFTAHAKDLFHETVDYSRLRSILRDAAHTVTISSYNQRFLAAEFPAETGRLELVRNGLELARFPFRAPREPAGPLRVAAVGRLVEKKGFPLLIDAVQELRRRGTEVELRIAGGGELADALAARIQAAGLGPSARLTGPLTQTEVAGLLRWADVFAAPCIVGADGNADGLPTVLLEAMAMGVPAIASDVTGIPEVIQPAGRREKVPDGGIQAGAGAGTGILVRAGSLEDLVAALELAASGGFDRAATARNARALIENHFDARLQAQRLRQLESPPAARQFRLEGQVA